MQAVQHFYLTWVFPACRVIHYPRTQYTETIFEDGSKVPASPIDSEHYRQTAERLGYGKDTGRMSLEHELAHHIISFHKGFLHSPTLWAVAHNLKADNAEHLAEEAEVMNFTAYLNGRGLCKEPEWADWSREFLATVRNVC